MGDELIFGEKIYISSARSAEITGYTNDYLGRLCREEKVLGKLVGRTWYLEKDSLMRYVDERHITGIEAARGIGCSNDYLSRLLRKGKLRGRLIGNAWRIEKESFADFLRARDEKKKRSLSAPVGMAAKDSFS